LGGGQSPSARTGQNAQVIPSSVTQVNLGKDVRVVADNNNALLIHARAGTTNALRQPCANDITPNQVLIEASIVEVAPDRRDQVRFVGILKAGWAMAAGVVQACSEIPQPAPSTPLSGFLLHRHQSPRGGPCGA
jgi:hypothetical protein